jgi:hypothetical protein
MKHRRMSAKKVYPILAFDLMDSVGSDERLILTFVLMKYDVMVWAGSFYSKLETSCRLL